MDLAPWAGGIGGMVLGGVILAALTFVARELRQLRIDLVTHMGHEETDRAHEATERETRQGDLNVRLERIEHRLDDGAGRFDRLEDGIAGLHAEVARTMRALAGGNPEARHYDGGTWQR